MLRKGGSLVYKCVHGCGYESNHKGAMNLHDRIHCKTLKKGAREVPKATKEKSPCDCADGGKWRLLNAKSEREQTVIDAGYKKICTECWEVA
jgi:hypothetical protein